MAKLMKPLFIGGMYNKEGKRIRANYLRTISYGEKEYPLWINDGKPDKEYAKNDKDRYYLYIQFNDWLVMTGLTELNMIENIGWEHLIKEWYGDIENRRKYLDEHFYKGKTYQEYGEPIKEYTNKENKFVEEHGSREDFQVQYINQFVDKAIKQYIDARDNNGRFANFVGALFLNELDKCAEIASVLKKEREKEYLERSKKAQEEKEKKRIEQEQAEKALIEETENVLLNEGTIKGGEIIVKLADKHGVDIPIRTRGWILHNLSETTISEGGRGISYRYWKRSKNAKGSQAVYGVLYGIIKAIRAT